jgi:hypothetical protein
MELHFQEHINNKEMTFSKKAKKNHPYTALGFIGILATF